MSCPLPLDFQLKFLKVSEHLLHIVPSLTISFWLCHLIFLLAPFVIFLLFLIVCMHVVLVVVVVGCMQHTNQIMQDIPYFCEGALQFPPCLLQDISSYSNWPTRISIFFHPPVNSESSQVI